MLKNIPAIISPELLYNMMKMGHGDELILADGDFPVETFSKRVVYAYGHEIPALLEAILEYYPLDPFVEKPVAIMAPVEKDAEEPLNWEVYRSIISKRGEHFKDFEYVERFEIL